MISEPLKIPPPIETLREAFRKWEGEHYMDRDDSICSALMEAVEAYDGLVRMSARNLIADYRGAVGLLLEAREHLVYDGDLAVRLDAYLKGTRVP